MNAQQILDELVSASSGKVAAIVDYTSGMLLASSGTGVDMEAAASGNTEVVKAKMKTMKALGLNDTIEDILITLGKQYHIIRPCVSHDGLFIYLVLDKTSNLAMARRKVQEAETNLKI